MKNFLWEPPAMPETAMLDIQRVGAQGDGIAERDGKSIFVPFALAGERVAVEVEGERARLINVVQASQNRVAPVCPHFGSCGGCAVQHMSKQLYRAWKRDIVVQAFASRGLAPVVADLIRPEGKRRRATFTARKTNSSVLLGFHEAGSHQLVDIDVCPVMEPAIVSGLPALRKLIEPMLSRKGEARITVTMSSGGLDIAIAEIERTLDSGLRSTLAQAARTGGFARVSFGGDTAYEALQTGLAFGTVDVVLPPGGFVQAVAAAEETMAGLVMQAIGKSKSVADLFSGIGAFAFRLAARCRVFAADSDRPAIAALLAAQKTARKIKPITAIVRDLYREPLSAMELKDFDALVFDPPRAGAEAQARMIARSKVKTVVAVSCNPATLARDARILVDGGYALGDVTPIDQFHYAPHVECVAVFRR
jgi:23S rRNA (uracil1939-C5)-methyltransferase